MNAGERKTSPVTLTADAVHVAAAGARGAAVVAAAAAAAGTVDGRHERGAAAARVWRRSRTSLGTRPVVCEKTKNEVDRVRCRRRRRGPVTASRRRDREKKRRRSVHARACAQEPAGVCLVGAARAREAYDGG